MGLVIKIAIGACRVRNHLVEMCGIVGQCLLALEPSKLQAAHAPGI
jgi:hypothetical protein